MATRLPENVKELVGRKTESLVKTVREFNDVHAAGLSVAAPAAPGATSTPTKPTPRRTVCQPVFSPPDAPVSCTAKHAPAKTMVLKDFENSTERLGLEHHASSRGPFEAAMLVQSHVQLRREGRSGQGERADLAHQRFRGL